MWREIGVLTATVVVAGCVAAWSSEGANADDGAAPARPQLRVGVYDNRAIAVAFAHSSFNPVAGKMKAYDEAKEAGDEAAMEQLEAWGNDHQRQLHRQGFGRVPVTDLLEYVEDDLPALAAKLDVDVIAFECNYRAEHVEEVDVTLELVGLFNPDERALRTAREVMKHKPIDLNEVEAHHDH